MSVKSNFNKGVKTNVIEEDLIDFVTYRNESKYKSPQNVNKKTAERIRKWQAKNGRMIIDVFNSQTA